MLSQYSTDSSLKNKAKLAFEWYMSTAIAEYLDGHWVTGTSRDNQHTVGFTVMNIA